MTKTPLAAAQEDLTAKQAAATEAEALVTEASQLLIIAEAATMSADAKSLDRAITNAATASARVDILGKKLVIARDRAAAAAQLVKNEEASELALVAAEKLAELGKAEEALVANVVALVAELTTVWQTAREAHRVADQANNTAAKARGERAVPLTSKISSYARVMDGKLDLFVSTGNVIRWLDEEPLRAAEARRREQEKSARLLQEQLEGLHGPEARRAARAATEDARNALFGTPTRSVFDHDTPSIPLPSEAEARFASEQELFSRGMVAARHVNVAAVE